MPVFAAAISGGIGNPYGAMLGSAIIAMAENFGLYIDFGKLITLNGLLGKLEGIYIPTGYKLAISFLIMIVVLLFRPQGILPKR